MYTSAIFSLTHLYIVLREQIRSCSIPSVYSLDSPVFMVKSDHANKGCPIELEQTMCLSMTSNHSHVDRGSMHVVKYRVIYSPERNTAITHMYEV